MASAGNSLRYLICLISKSVKLLLVLSIGMVISIPNIFRVFSEGQSRTERNGSILGYTKISFLGWAGLGGGGLYAYMPDRWVVYNRC